VILVFLFFAKFSGKRIFILPTGINNFLPCPKTGITKTYTALPPVDFEECLVMLGLDPPKWKDLVWVK
jgi:hypothetical protein